jgi:hypothetical protein
MSQSAQDRNSIPLRLTLIFLLLGLAAYYTVLNSYFLSDDFAQIGKVLEGDWSFTWGREHGGFFRPLFILSYILDASIWKENPFGYHLTNTWLHAVNSLLVCRLALKLLQRQALSVDRARAVSVVAGLLFLLHPSHTETVSWISGRADLLATALCLMSMILFISYAETRRARKLALALGSFTLALLAKESAVSLPFILFSAGLYFARDRSRKAALLQALKDVALFFPILILFILLRRVELGSWLGGYGASQHLNFSPGWLWARFLQASLRSLVPALPHGFSPVFLKPLKSTVFLVSALTSAALIFLLIRRRRRTVDACVRGAENSLLLFLSASFVLSLLPVINLRLSIFDTQGERFIYWPSVFSVTLLAYLAFILLRSIRWWAVLLPCVLIFYSVCLYRTNQTWAEAARLSRSIKDELGQGAQAGQSVVVINLPDNLRGVPVYHNGLEEALRLFQKSNPIEGARVLALHGLQSVDDPVELKREGDALRLRLPGGADEFASVANGVDCIEMIEGEDARSLKLRLMDCARQPQLFFFNAGKIYRVVSEAGSGVGDTPR